MDEISVIETPFDVILNNKKKRIRRFIQFKD